jgi:hypothetical protein
MTKKVPLSRKGKVEMKITMSQLLIVNLNLKLRMMTSPKVMTSSTNHHQLILFNVAAELKEN